MDEGNKLNADRKKEQEDPQMEVIGSRQTRSPSPRPDTRGRTEKFSQKLEKELEDMLDVKENSAMNDQT